MSILTDVIPAIRLVLYGDESEERRAMVEVDAATPEDTALDTGMIDLHIDPGTDDVVTVMLKPEDAWRLVRELSRAARDAER